MFGHETESREWPSEESILSIIRDGAMRDRKVLARLNEREHENMIARNRRLAEDIADIATDGKLEACDEIRYTNYPVIPNPFHDQLCGQYSLKGDG